MGQNSSLFGFRIFAGLLLAGLFFGAPSGALAYSHKQTRSGERVHWNRSVVHFRLSPEVRALLGEGRAEAAFEDAAELWMEDPSLPVFALDEGDAEPLGFTGRTSSNGVYLAEDWPYSPRLGAISLVSFDSSTGRLVDTDILLNPRFTFGDYPEPGPPGARGIDLSRMLAHELGHCLGLEHSEVDGAIMHHLVPRARRAHALHDDDREGVLVLYEGIVLQSDLGTTGTAAYGCAASGTTPTGAFTFALALLPLLRRRRE